jgi:GxxExxY protein
MREEESKKEEGRSFWEYRSRDAHRVDDKTEQLATTVLGAAIEVHRHLGPGHPERAYETTLCVELSLREIPHERQRPIHLKYKGHPIGDSFVDVVVGGTPVVEIKAVEALHPTHIAQTSSYLVALDLELGLLINFNVPLLKEGFKRVIRTKP